MLKRSITGAIFLLVVISAIVLNAWSFSLLFLLIIILGLLEFYSLLEKSGHYPQKWTGIGLGVLIFSAAFAALAFNVFVPLGLILPAVFLIFIFELYRKKENPFTNIAYTLLGVLYVALPFTLWLLVTIGNEFKTSAVIHNWHYVLGFFFIMWTADTGAYLAGRSLGKNKLFERISPKKTWEGLIGGIILSCLIAWLNSIYYNELKLHQWLIVALITSIFGVWGDLVESLLKRSLNVKDSGTLLPGHGGILDRFDGVFIATPFVISYILLIRSH